nr:uncharacterized protein CTRU02_02018 [Colletotrichum truncatum]KAF6799147.1 hypothetical protein CTRU02_02018 [Colletotrichum truncatum]
MKAALPIIALCASFVAAVAVPTAHNTDGLSIRTAEEIEDMPIVDLQVIDERFGDQVFSGTYQSAVAQMKALKPELFADETEDVSVELGLEKRQGAPVSCNWGERIGSWNQCIDGMVSLGRAGDKCLMLFGECIAEVFLPTSTPSPPSAKMFLAGFWS